MGRRFDPDRAHVRIYIDVGAHFEEHAFKTLSSAQWFELIKDSRIQQKNFSLGSKHEPKNLRETDSIDKLSFLEKDFQ